MEKIKENGVIETPQESERQRAEITEDKILSEMAKEEEGEYNQEELVDDITHDLRISKTRRG